MKRVQSAVELLGVVLFRFRPLPRTWAILLIFVNLSSVFFLDTVYGQVAFAAMCIGVVIMVSIHYRLGFVRLLGIGHILWIPMLAWFLLENTDIDTNDDRWLSLWLWCLIVCNSISLVIDAIDVTRFILGDRTPHYSWDRPSTTKVA